MAKILVGSTIPAFAMTDRGHWWQWLKHAEQTTRTTRDETGHDVEWLAVLQHDSRGRDLFAPLLARLDAVWKLTGAATATRWFSLDLGEEEITGGNRLIAICTARNLISEYALRSGHDWIYFADADISAPRDVLVRLLELQWPVCGAHVPTYGLDGPSLHDSNPLASWIGRSVDARWHWNTAGSLLIAREAFRRVPWRYDLDAGETDDPATQAELARLGWPTLVRHDVVCTHHPTCIGPLETRGHDLAVYR